MRTNLTILRVLSLIVNRSQQQAAGRCKRGLPLDENTVMSCAKKASNIRPQCNALEPFKPLRHKGLKTEIDQRNDSILLTSKSGFKSVTARSFAEPKSQDKITSLDTSFDMPDAAI